MVSVISISFLFMSAVVKPLSFLDLYHRASDFGPLPARSTNLPEIRFGLNVSVYSQQNR